MNRLRKNGPALRLLQKAPTSLQKNILDKASPELIRCICECAHNVLQGNVTLSRHYKKKLSQHKTKLRKLTDRKVALKKKKTSRANRWISPAFAVGTCSCDKRCAK